MRLNEVDLLADSPAKALGKLSLPIMATSFVQMAYNLTDMFWIGWLGAFAVAAVGSAGMFMWFSEGISLIPRMGGQALGAGDVERARRFCRTALQSGAVFASIFMLLAIFLRKQMISVFALNESATVAAAELYLAIVALGTLPSFLVRIMTGLLTAAGNSHTPFRITVVGLVLNMLLDPLFIFVFLVRRLQRCFLRPWFSCFSCMFCGRTNCLRTCGSFLLLHLRIMAKCSG